MQAGCVILNQPDASGNIKLAQTATTSCNGSNSDTVGLIRFGMVICWHQDMGIIAANVKQNCPRDESALGSRIVARDEPMRNPIAIGSLALCRNRFARRGCSLVALFSLQLFHSCTSRAVQLSCASPRPMPRWQIGRVAFNFALFFYCSRMDAYVQPILYLSSL